MTVTMTAAAATTINEFFRRFGAGDLPGALELFAHEVDFQVAGAEFVPWTGRRSNHAQIAQFLKATTEEVDTEEFEVEKVLADGEDAVVLGRFTHRVKRTGKAFSCRFALSVVVAGGRIRRYHMFEDSYAVAAAFTG